jgi:hypothetical protein
MSESDTYAELVEFCAERDRLRDQIWLGRMKRDPWRGFHRERLIVVQRKIVELVGRLEACEGASK